MIPQSFIQDLLHRVDIVDVVDRHVKLKRAGANYAACCPFHNEKTPSFTVSPSKQFYHCFGCGAHGTAIGFVMEYNGLGFVDAVKQLAQSAGMQVPESRTEAGQRRAEAGEDLYAILLAAAQFYRARLKDAPDAIDYLRKRGMSGEIARRFGVGYAPEGWQNLAAAFPDYNAKALVTAGLVKAGEEGRRYDVFRDRIMFPIVDVRGNVIGFGGRVLERADSGIRESDAAAAARSSPKYLNSPETPIFEKGRELYGLYQARRAIREAGRVVVVEGYMDVVALAQHGVEYAVATLGTATTPLHVQKLLRQADEVVFCFDGDEAGRRAAWRALENSLAQLVDGKQVKFLFLPHGEDPDSYVRQRGKADFEGLVAAASPLSAFLLTELSGRVELSSHEGRARLLQEARPLVGQITAPLLSLMLRKRLAELAGITQGELDAQYHVKAGPAAPPPRSRLRGGRHDSFIRPVIELLCYRPELARLADRRAIMHGVGLAGINQAELEGLNRLLELLEDDPNVTSVPEYFRDTSHRALFEEIETALILREEAQGDPEVLRQEFEDGWRKLVRSLTIAEGRALDEKSKLVPLTAAEKSRYRAIHQMLTDTRSGRNENRV
jgi:DNA primase